MVRVSASDFPAPVSHTERTLAARSKVVLKLLEKLRRSPEHNRFALIGTVDRDLAKRFLIGKGRTLVASDSGELSSSRTTIPSGADRCRRAD